MLVLTPSKSSKASTTSSRAAFPDLSPSPLTVTCTVDAPPTTAANELATASPKSL
jgi:hypothetical protein